ncbi:MAG: hypothetical protein H7240_12345 [Glaciimonas sp.]|nr:hypothetical protein [Glaciimonas sp.]
MSPTVTVPSSDFKVAMLNSRLLVMLRSVPLRFTIVILFKHVLYAV